MSKIYTQPEADSEGVLNDHKAVTGTDVAQEDGSSKRAIDTVINNKIEVDPNTLSQVQLNTALQNINETLLRIEFILKSIGE